MESPTYRIAQFEGPLDLLLSLISKNKVSITDIPIAVICDQYMEYIEQAQRMDMELAAEFIVMASELLLIKSRMLLPKADEEEEDPRAALADALLKYQQAKAAVEVLAPLYSEFSGRMSKDTDEIPPDRGYVTEHDIALLVAAMKRVLASGEAVEKAAGTHFAPMIKAAPVPVELKLQTIMLRLREEKRLPLIDIFRGSRSRSELVAAFIAVLELLRERRLTLISGSEDGTLEASELVVEFNAEAENDVNDSDGRTDAAPDSGAPGYGADTESAVPV